MIHVHLRTRFPVMSRVLLSLLVAAAVGSCSMDRATNTDSGPADLSGDATGPIEYRTAPTLQEGSSSLPAGKQARREILTTASALISAEKGGRVKLHWHREGGDTRSQVDVTVTVKPGALDEDTDVFIALVNSETVQLRLDLAFGQHGTRFKIPAVVEVAAMGLVLDDKNAWVDFYWFDPATEIWTAVPRNEKKFHINYQTGSVRGVWYFSHFSRYSLSGGNKENCCWGYLP